MSRYLIPVVLTVIVCFPSVAFAQPSSERLNFLFVIADDCTYRDLACYGGQAATPHLDRLAREGMLFENCFQAAPMCSPTRHCLYTGLYPVRSGAYPNHTFAREGTKSIAQDLQAGGYRVALSGKTHINPPEVFPFEYSQKKDQGTNPDFAAIDQLIGVCSQSDTPFCVFACSNEPHTPYTHGDPGQYPPGELALPPVFVDTPETREAFSKYLAEITYFDSQVGRCLQLLDKHGVAENTLVMVVSEQGSSFPFAKWTCYDAGVQSGMIVRWPGKVQPGSRTAAMVEYVDVVPTFLDCAGQDPARELDGRSFRAVLEGEADEHKRYSYALQTTRGIINGSPHYGIRTVRDDRYRLVWNLSPGEKFENAVYRTGWWDSWIREATGGSERAALLVQRYGFRPEFELYDCAEDPWNQQNLAGRAELAETKQRLLDELQRWMADQGDEGTGTEMAALSRQWRRRNNKE